MSEVRSICAYYSHGPHFRRLLGFLQARYPEASITAVVPPHYPVECIHGWTNLIQKSELASYGFRDLRALLRLRRELSASGYDMIVVMFDSPRLRLLAASTGIPHRYCYGPNGRFHPIRAFVWTELVRSALRRLAGWLTYLHIRWVVKHRPVQDNAPQAQPNCPHRQ